MKKQTFLVIAKAIAFGAFIGLIFPFLYLFLAGIISNFLSGGTDWLKDGIFDIVLMVLWLPLGLGPRFLPISIVAFTLGGVISGFIGVLYSKQHINHFLLTGTIIAVIGFISYINIMPIDESHLLSDDFVIFHLPVFFLIATIIWLGFYVYKSILKSHSSSPKIVQESE